MGFSTFFFLLFIVAITTVTSQSFDPCSSSGKSDGSDLSIIPIYGKCSPFKPPNADSLVNSVLNMASNDHLRVNYLSSLVGLKPISTPIASAQQVLNSANYVVRVKLGTPGQIMFMVVDTSNDGAWVPCSGCVGCSSTTYVSNMSTSFVSVDCTMPECTQVHGLSCPTTGSSECSFSRTYGGDSSFTATLSRDSLTLGRAQAIAGPYIASPLGMSTIPKYTFGCINSVTGKAVPPQGLLGLGRGPMSLLSQSGDLYSGVFSYCLPSFKSYYFSGSLKLGPLGQPKSIKTTPLLKNPHRPSLYYVNLTGISVGKVLVPTAPKFLSFDPVTGAGTVIDSGTVITRFVIPVYEAVRDEFRNQVKGPFSSLGAFDTCFAATNEDVAPALTLHFEGMDLKLPMENSLIHSSAGTLACLAMAAAPNNVNSVLNVIANLQQQNLRILFDVANSRLGIARELCN